MLRVITPHPSPPIAGIFRLCPLAPSQTKAAIVLHNQKLQIFVGWCFTCCIREEKRRVPTIVTKTFAASRLQSSLLLCGFSL